jgi:hypothetical protein
MKKMFTLLSAICISASVFAGWNQTRLSISTMGSSSIRVMIDGQRIQQNDNAIRISYLNPGTHTVQIYRMSRNRGGWGRGNNRNQGELIYNVNLHIRNGMHTDILINRFGRVFVDEQPIDNRDDEWNNSGGWNNNNGGWNNNGNWNGQQNGWSQQMDNQRFQQLKNTVQDESFDDNKLSLVRSVLPNNYVSSSQVRELMQLMSFERNKLELAKFAYRYTTDRGSYFIVNDVFSFSSSKTELSNYIMNYRD